MSKTKSKPTKEQLKHDINENPYFVMLHLDNAYGCLVALPLMTEDDEIVCFPTYEAAEKSASQNPLGKAYGYEIFCHGNGE